MHIFLLNKELEKETNEILKELASYEKENINLGERKKHAISKRKKMMEAISTVSFILFGI